MKPEKVELMNYSLTHPPASTINDWSAFLSKRCWLSLLVLFIWTTSYSTQNADKQPVYELFPSSSLRSASQEKAELTSGSLFTLDSSVLMQLIEDSPVEFTLPVPVFDGDNLILHLHQVDIFSEDFQFVTSDNDVWSSVDLGLHYRGTLQGSEHSIIAISFFNDEVKGVIIGDDRTYDLGPLSKGINDYICYSRLDFIDEMKERFNFICGTLDERPGVYSDEQLHYAQLAPGDVTDIYIEVDKSLFDAEGGSVPGTTSYVTALFNESAALFEAESIFMNLSEVFVWTSPDPYDGVNTDPDIRGAYLEDFQDEFDGFNGDLAVLLLADDIGGKAAGFAGICNADPDLSMCVAGRSEPDLYPFPTYSYNIYNFSHELGHLFGSRHTHACVWNGDDTAIDGCSATEGGCPLPPIPSSGEATIMSYCQDELAGGFIASAPFGPQPGAVIRSTIAAATCLGCTTEENLFLPDTVGSGPAIILCDTEPAPPGYSIAGSQFCALSTIESDPACIDFSWDGLCQSSYEACVELGCEDPIITCPANVTETAPSGATEMVVDYPAPMGMDSCSSVTIECIPASGSVFSVGTTTVTCIATHEFGNADTCSFEVTVNEAVAGCEVPTDMDVVEIGFGTANARVNATWTNPNETTDCEVRGGRIAPSSIGTGTPLFANINNTRVITQTNGSTVLFNVVLYNNPNVPFVIGQTYGYEVRCQCEDGSEYTNWSGMTPESTFIVPSPPASNLAEDTGNEAKWLNETVLSIFPNPNGGEELMVVLTGLDEEEGIVQIELLDITGRLVQNERISVKGDQINYRMTFEERLPSGIYMLRASQDTMTLSKRLVIE